MAFRMVSGTPPQGAAPAGETPSNQEVTVKATPTTAPVANSLPVSPRQAVDAQALVPLVERLETLSFTFEALNASSRTYAAEAVLETLGRMERRDLQALAAIEAFASALKTVSQHLAGLRNAIQTTAHDTAGGFHLMNERLDQMESRLGGPALPAGSGNALTTISDRLGHIEEMIGAGETYDPAPIATMLEAMVHKVAEVGDKMDGLAGKVEEMPDRVAEAVDMAPVANNLETIAERMASVERKIDEAKQIDVTPLREALDTISQRVARIEHRIEQAPGAPMPEGFDPAPLTEVLGAISARITAMEERSSSGGNVDALTSFLDMINKRLERMEAGIASPAKPAPAKPPVQVKFTPATSAPVKTAAPQPQPQPPAPPVVPPAPLTASETTHPVETKQQVDNLLEQVLKVLSR